MKEKTEKKTNEEPEILPLNALILKKTIFQSNLKERRLTDQKQKQKSKK